MNVNRIGEITDPTSVVTDRGAIPNPNGTVAANSVSLTTITSAAETRPKPTVVVQLTPEPVITTVVPRGPLVGVMLPIIGALTSRAARATMSAR